MVAVVPFRIQCGFCIRVDHALESIGCSVLSMMILFELEQFVGTPQNGARGTQCRHQPPPVAVRARVVHHFYAVAVVLQVHGQGKVAGMDGVKRY